MKGIVFNLLEQVVGMHHGEDVWEDALDSAGVEGAYTAVGTYPDEELRALVGALAERLQTSPDQATRWFGREALPLLAERYPAFFAPHTSAREFLLTLNGVIHPEVRKLFPDAYAPQFDFELREPDGLDLGYVSHRGMCAFAEGLIEGSADHFGQTVMVEHLACAKYGGDRCLLRCTFSHP